MFERRLKSLLLIPLLFGIVLIGRLYQLQIAQGEDYERKAEEALVSPRKFLPPLRGRILDRFGRTLVSDEPAYDVCVYYGALSVDPSYLQRLARRLKRGEPTWQSVSSLALETEIRQRIKRMWITLEAVSQTPLRVLLERRGAICSRVDRYRLAVWNERRTRGFMEPLDSVRLREENWFHAVLSDITPDVRTQIELELTDLPFVRVEPSVRRIWAQDVDPLCHVLGSLGQVSAERIASDLHKDDPLAGYRLGDRAGISGIERLGEMMLRGKRGFEDLYLDGAKKERVSPIDGMDVQLTIDFDLQRYIAETLEQVFRETEPSTGGSCVILDIKTREILALVSVPTYTRDRFIDDYPALRDDARQRPLLFRAVMEEYQPGSMMKPVALLAGFKHNLVNPDTTSFCDGSFIAGSPHWHCWTHWKGMPGHGDIAAEEAIQHSCNVYFYGLGQRLGARRLTDFYREFILGLPEAAPAGRMGTGLIEERTGIIPSQEYLQRTKKRSFRTADGRNYAIGQGEMQITPLQAANIFATLASGKFREPTLIANDQRDRPEIAISGITDEAWQLVRRGLYRCVNEIGGTGYKYARMDRLEVCGKTATAQCVARVVLTRYTFEQPDGGTVSVITPTIEKAREELGLSRGATCLRREVVKRWPPDRPDKGTPPSHAWFTAFAPRDDPTIALAVIIEHGGSGGRVAGPVGRSILEYLLDNPRGYFSDTQVQARASLSP